ncbi:c-type cytochrome [Rhizobium laguerreae]|uniref:c-type cytochrome n=1 Tax=Rhizobium laguerreae TaxID=1076926 RepID=UPI0035E40DA7
MQTVLDPRDQRRQLCKTTKNDLLAYKARPLDGIWATAPYLHNGSVPTLYVLRGSRQEIASMIRSVSVMLRLCSH